MKRLPTLLLAILFGSVVLAQDADHFFSGRSQMLLDPSRAGLDAGGRVAFIHQDQWLQLPGSWRSEFLSVDWCARNTKKPVSSWLGLGFLARQEQQGGQGSRLASLALVPAVHLRAGSRSYLSLGMEVRWVNGTTGVWPGTWGSQYNGQVYDAALPSGETSAIGESTWLESRAGISWTLKQDRESAHRRERNKLVAGLAADHLGRLTIQQEGAFPSAPPMRFTAYALGELPHQIWDDGFFAGELIGNMQGTSYAARFNVYAGKHLLNVLNDEGGPMHIGFKAGLGYRLHDALLVNAAMDVNRTTLGLAYGWAMRSTDRLAAGRRTVEVLLQVRFAGAS
ncbi:MAG: type IX secretion system membrane protein PorP/SprF [Flavobacteriales bacterium]|nr:type IX secretion system membrane protein PorP/SprF [Flavobacteriales bacterium]MBP9178767.1 type IX secretion system membrane protein PorP/SprF [Flavobacteriales bacterium]